MSATIPTTEFGGDESFRQKDTVKFTVSLSDYLPEDGWTLRYAFKCNALAKINVDSTDNGDGTHLITITSAVSATFEPGLWYYQGTVDNGTEYYTLRRGRIKVEEAFLDVTDAYDPRSQTKIHLDLVEALLEGKLTRGDAASYSIAGRSLTSYSQVEILDLRDRLRAEYRAEIRAEDAARGRGTPAKVRVTFTAA